MTDTTTNRRSGRLIVAGALVAADDWMDRHGSLNDQSYRTPRAGENTQLTLMTQIDEMCHLEIPRSVWAPHARPSDSHGNQVTVGDIVTLTRTAATGWTVEHRQPLASEQPLALAAFRRAFNLRRKVI